MPRPDAVSWVLIGLSAIAYAAILITSVYLVVLILLARVGCASIR
jgi:hypothetical protein